MSTTSSSDDTKMTSQNVTENDSDGLLPGCWLETPWDPSTIGSVTEQSRIIDLIPMFQTQWLRSFLFWIVIIVVTLGLGIFAPPLLMESKLPLLNLIEIGRTGLDRWLEGIILFLAAGTGYLTWCIRRQKPECFTPGYVLLIITVVCLYMSIDRIIHVTDTLIQCVNVALNPPLDNKGCLFWEALIYGTIYLALLSRLLIEFSGASLSQTFLLLATAGYVCSFGVWFAPEEWHLPFTAQILSGSLTLLGDFFLFWSMVNYTRFLLIDGFGLAGYGWRKAMSRYKSSERQYSIIPTIEPNHDFSTLENDNKPNNKTENINDIQNTVINSENKTIDEKISTTGLKPTEETGSLLQKDMNSVITITQSSLTQTEKTDSSNVTQSSNLTGSSTFNVTSTATTSPSSVSVTVGQTSPITQQPLPQYSSPTSSYPQSSLGVQQYPQSNNQQPYTSQPYSPQFNSPYGFPTQNNHLNYGQPQPLYSHQPSFGQQVYPQSYLPQQTVQQPIPTQPVIQQQAQTFSQVVTQTATNSIPLEQESLNLSSVSLSALEIQQEFKLLEERIHRPLTHEEKKAVVRRMIKSRQEK